MSNRPRHNPGSDEAIAAGCTCPVIDNNHGKGVPVEGGKVAFWHDAMCPYHDDNDIARALRVRAGDYHE